MEDEDEILDSDVSQPLSAGFVAVIYGKAAFNLIASFACFFFIIAMLADKKVRSNAYNLYVLFMIVPDGINTFFRTLFNLFIAANDGVKLFPPGYFPVDLFFWMFYYVSNFYTNTVVTYEIDKLLRYSYIGKRVDTPTTRKVLKQVGAVYIFAFFMSFLMVVPVPFSLFYITDERRGEGTSGSPPGGLLTPFVAIMINLATMAIPLIYVLFVRIRIWKRDLLPETGRTRALSSFFLRVVIIFVLFYVPNIVLTQQRQGMDDTSTGAFIVDTLLGIMAACQALTSLYMIWLKDDIREAVSTAWNKSFGWICCAWCTCNYQKRELPSSEIVRVSGLAPPSRRNIDTSSSVGGLYSKRSGDSLPPWSEKDESSRQDDSLRQDDSHRQDPSEKPLSCVDEEQPRKSLQPVM